MPIFDIFKKKKKTEEEKKKPEKEKKVRKEKKEKKVEGELLDKQRVLPKAGIPSGEKPKRRKVRVAPLVLASPHIAEKPTRLANVNQYVFKVYPKANKTEIKKAVEEIYGVDVLKVRIVKVPRKRRRLGRIRGWRKGYKKAIVAVKEGQKIDILPR